MSADRTGVASLVLALLVVAAGFTAAAGPASAAEQTFVIEQGDRCIPVTPLSGSENVVDFYDYRNPYNTNEPDNYSYSSHMPGQLTAAETSRLFLYDGPGGVSLVLIHGALDARSGDSAATFTFSGLPSSGDWAVVDDDYSGRDDRISRSRIDWTWKADRTDGGVFRGIDRADLDVTIDAAWNEEAALYDDPVQRSGHVTRWQVLSGSAGNPEVTALPMSAPITLRAGTCGSDDTTAPTASVAADPTEATVNESVTFDARDARDDSGITEYRWDFDGDGEVDRTTDTYRVTHAYGTAGAYEAAVTVADAAGNVDTATVTVTVTEGTGPDARAAIPETAVVGEPVPVDGSASTDDRGIAEYEWSFGDGGHALGENASHVYNRAGTYTVELAVTDADGNTDTTSAEITVVEPTTETPRRQRPRRRRPKRRHLRRRQRPPRPRNRLPSRRRRSRRTAGVRITAPGA